MSVQPNENRGQLPEVRGADAAATRASANEIRVQLTRQEVALKAEMAAAKADLERRRAEAEMAFKEQVAALEAQMAPMRAELAKMTEVLHTVDLYLGRSEEMTLLRDGEPAGPDEVIVVRQQVLAADEESLVLVESGGVDARKMNAFLEWVAASPENTARLLPEPKCVVAVVPSRQSRDYGDPWLKAAVDAANAQTHWLFRNGEQLWVMVTDFIAGSTLIPRYDEFTGFFAETDWFGKKTGRTLVPGSDEWLKAEQAADARKRHYMKIGMILQGVLDRTEVFAPLPEGGVNILTAAQEQLQQVRFVNELDMALDDGRETFRKWQRRLNSQLQPGMRIVGDFSSNGGFGQEYRSARDSWRGGYHPYLTPDKAAFPTSGEVYPIEGRNSSGEMIFRYVRHEQIDRRVKVRGTWRDHTEWEYGAPKNRASCIVRPDDSWILPYDLATVEELAYYLDHRAARKDYLNMVPVLRAALEAKRAERDAEAPFRTLLSGILAEKHGMDVAEVESLLPEVVDRWKLGNKHHRALTGDREHEAKAIRGISTDFAAALSSKAGEKLPPSVEATAWKRFGSRMLAVLAKRDGSFLAVVRSTGGPNPFGLGWVDTMAITKTGKAGEVTEWTTIPARTLSRTVVAWADKAWATWVQPDPASRLTGPELEAVAEEVRNRVTEQNRRYRLFAVMQALNDGYPAKPTWTVDAATFDPESGRVVTFSQRWRRVKGQVELVASPYRNHSGGYAGKVTVDGVEYDSGHDISFPWVESGNHYHGDLSRARLVWLDADVFRDWMAEAEERKAKAKAERAEHDAAWNVFGEWRKLHDAALEEHLRSWAHGKFVEEFGTEAEDLFEGWFGTQKLGPARALANNEATFRDWPKQPGKRLADIVAREVPEAVAGYRFPGTEEVEHG